MLDQVKAIQRNSNYEVVVFKTNALTHKEEDYEIQGVHVHPIRPLLMPSYLLNGLTGDLVGKLFVKKLRQLGIKPKDVAFVHCHTANHAAFGFGVKRENIEAKVLIQFHDLDPYTLRNGIWAQKRWNIRYRAKKSLAAFNKADMLISISQSVQDNLLAFPKARPQETYASYLERLRCLTDFPPVRPNNLYVLYNGVDTTLFKSLNNSSTVTKQQLFRIGCVANFQELKDHITLIKAFEILHQEGYRNMVLSLLGSGPTKDACYSYLQEHELLEFVEWKEEITHGKLPDYYNTLDLFVLPSIYEGFGCVYTEAYACGVPFMGVYGQGASECIEPEERNLWLISPHDYKQLAVLIAEYYEKRYKQNLRMKYDIDSLIIDFLKIIKTL